VKLPTPADIVRAAVSIPRSVIHIDRSLSNFAQTLALLDTVVRRLDRLTEPLEGPLTALAPRLDALVALLDEDTLKALVLVLDSVKRNAVPALDALGQTQNRAAPIAASVERLTRVMDDTFSRLTDITGAGPASPPLGEGPEQPPAPRPGRPGTRLEET
jgi:hypothetical protein